MKERGYRLNLFYLWLPSVDMAIARVAHRVEEGGHNILEEVIRRRFDAGARNLLRVYLPLFDTWVLFDSSTVRPREIACCESGKTTVLDARLFANIIRTQGDIQP
jgi:predicted ABC-type ATPase